MKTNIALNKDLVNDAMLLSKAGSKTEAVDLALKHFIAHLKRRNTKNLFGKIAWEGDLDEMRSH